MNEKKLEEQIEIGKYKEDYSEKKFWKKLQKFAQKLGLKTTAYCLILYYILQKKEVPMKEKTLIIGTLGYFIVPVDLMPDFIPAIGYGDDALGIFLAIRKCLQYIDEDVKKKVGRKLIEWFHVEEKYMETLMSEIKK